MCSLSAERGEDKAPLEPCPHPSLQFPSANDLHKETTEQQVCKKQAEQKWHHDRKARDRECAERETVLSRNYDSDPKWVRGRIGKQCGPVSYHVELPDGRV